MGLPSATIVGIDDTIMDDDSVVGDDKPLEPVAEVADEPAAPAPSSSLPVSLIAVGLLMTR